MLLLIISTIILASFSYAVMPEPSLKDNSYIKRTVITQESDYDGDGVPDIISYFEQINDTMVDIYVNDTREKGGYKWSSAICNISNIDNIEKLEYNSATGVWSNTGNLNYGTLWGMPDEWCNEHKGFSLYGSGSGDKRYRLILPRGQKEFKVFSGKGSEEVIYEWINSTLYIYETDTMEVEPFTIEIFCNDDKITTPDIQWITVNNPIGDGIKFSANITDFSCNGSLAFRQNKVMKTDCSYGYMGYTDCETSLIDYTDFETSEDNQLSIIVEDENHYVNKNIVDVKHSVLECLQFIDVLSWNDFINCKDIPYAYDITYYGNFTDLDPSLQLVYTSTSDIEIFGGQSNRTEATNLGVRTDAPILFMDFNKPPEGTYVQDNSIYNNFGTNNGATYNSTGGYDGSGGYSFDGNDKIVVADSNSLSFGNGASDSAFSISSWIKMSDATKFRIVTKSTATNSEYALTTDISDQLNLVLYDSVLTTNLQAYVPAITSYENKWIFITATYDGSGSENGIELYINGNGMTETKVENGAYTAMENTAGSLDIGYFEDINDYATGSLDQVQIWDRALSADEVLELYNGSVTGHNNSEYIGKYARDGDFKSMVFYNSTSTYWNTTLSIADSNGSANTYDLCQADANCVSYWDLDTGNTQSNPYKDEKGTNHGTPTGTNNATGLSSGAMKFDGNDDEINLDSYLSNFEGWNNGTISAWFKYVSGTNFPIFTLSDKSASGDFMHITAGSTTGSYADESILFAIWRGSAQKLGMAVREGHTAYMDGNWHHVAVTTGNGNNRVYIDGISKSFTFQAGSSTTDEFSDINNGDAIRIGKFSYNNNNNFWVANGSIDEVLIYNKSLTASEVEQLYKAGLTQHANANITLETRTATSYNISDTDLISLWGLNGDTTDETGNNDGTAHNSPTTSEEYGVVGKGYNFTGGVDDYILAQPHGWDETSSFSISIWVKMNSVTSGDSILSDRGGTNKFTTNLVYNDQNQFYWALGKNSVGSITAKAPQNFPVGDWHHIVVMFNTTNGIIYIDGKYQNVSTDYSFGDIAPTDVGFSLGGIWTGAALAYEIDGFVDEVRTYNKVLTDIEIQNLYELGSYHIEWNNWQDNGTMQDGVPSYSGSLSNFIQYRYLFNTNDTDVSPYVLNHSVSITDEVVDVIPDTTAPIWNNSFVNQTLEYCQETLHTRFNATDDIALSQYFINYTTLFSIDSELGNLTNISLTLIGEYPINVSVNDTSNNINSTDFKVTVQDTTVPLFTLPLPDNQTLLYLDDVFTQFNATDCLLQNWSINYTTLFAINSTGHLVNTTATVSDNYTINVSINDSSNNVNSTLFFIEIRSNDVTPPQFTEIPLNISINEEFENMPLVQFNATDNIGLSIFFINYTDTFTIGEATGIITNTSALYSNVYEINVSVNDTVNNVNSSMWKLTVEPVYISYINMTDSFWGAKAPTKYCFIFFTGQKCLDINGWI